MYDIYFWNFDKLQSGLVYERGNFFLIEKGNYFFWKLMGDFNLDYLLGENLEDEICLKSGYGHTAGVSQTLKYYSVGPQALIKLLQNYYSQARAWPKHITKVFMYERGKLAVF